MKRYPVYKDSGNELIGKIPVDWNRLHIKRVLKAVGNGTTATQVDYETDFPVSRIETISTGEINFEKVGYLEQGTVDDRFKLNQNDILLSHINSLFFVGNCALFASDNTLYHGMNLLRLQPNEKIDPIFLMHWLKGHNFRQLIRQEAKHAINQVSVPSSTFKAIDIPLPPPSDQEIIRKYLDHKTNLIDTLIQKKQKQIDLLQEQRAAIINQAVTKGLNPNVKMKDSGIEWLGEVPEHWQILKLKYLVAMKSGDGITSDSIDDSGNYPVYGGNGLRGFTSSFTHDGNYVLVGRQGALCGNVHLVKGRFWASEHAVVVTQKTSHDIIWISELLRTMNLNQYSESAAQPGISVEKIQNLYIAVPPEKESTEIAVFLLKILDKHQRIIKTLDQKISLSKEYRTTLISEVVTGKIDVRDEAIP